MAAKKRKKKSVFRSKFYWTLFVLVLLSLIAIRCGTDYLTGIMSEYEATRPKYAMAEACALFESKQFDRIQEYNTTIENYSDSERSEYTDFINGLVADKSITCKQVYSTDHDEKLFAIMAGDEKLGNFTLAHSGTMSKHGFPYWKLGTVTLIDVPESAYFITVPSDSTVSVGGRTLTAEDAVETGISDKRGEGFVPTKAIEFTYTKYRYAARFGEPDFEVTDKDGQPQQIETVSEVEFKCDIAYDTELQSRYSGNVIGVAERIARYTTNDADLDYVLKTVYPNSPAEKIIKNMDNKWAVMHSANKFQNEQADQFLRFGNNIFSCHVTFDYLLKTPNGTRKYPTAYTMYFYNDGNGKGFRLYNMAMY